MKSTLTLSLVLAFGGTLAVAQQMVCIGSIATVAGSYTYTATQMPVPGAAVALSASTGPPQLYSNTTVGQLIQNISGGGAFASASVFYLDGAGHVAVAATPSATVGILTNVGTYVVNNDCTIAVTLTDVFNTATNGPGFTVPVQATLNLVGLVLGGGSEIDLSMPLSASSTRASTVLLPGEFVSRLNVQMIRSFPYGCNASYLTGAYGLVGAGLSLVNGSPTGSNSLTTIQPATFYASLTLDGNGNVVMETVVPGSPLGSFEYTGSYTVNPDCSGTMMLTSFTLNTSQGSVSPPPLKVNFGLIPTAAYVSNSTVTLNGNANRASLLFNVVAQLQQFAGYGRAQ